MDPQYTPNPPPAPAPFTPTPTLLPGSFILLILLPVIPLLLFSLGARPPNTSSLPFSTNELFVTTTMICLATGAVLLLGVYPDVGGQIWGWIRDGDLNTWSPGLGGPPVQGTGFLGAIMEELGLKGLGGQMGLWTSAGSKSIRHEGEKPAPIWVWNERYRRWVLAPAPFVPESARGAPVTSRTMAHNHLTVLRTAHSRWYSPKRPSLILALFFMSCVVFLFVVLCGNHLRSAYETESSSSGGESGGSGGGSSKWVERELRKRKAEKPADTVKRVKQEAPKEAATEKKKGQEKYAEWKKKREKEKAQLIKELTKRKLPLADLESSNKDKGKDAKAGKGEDGEKQEKVEKKPNPEEEAKKSTGSRIKKALLGGKAEKPVEPDGTWQPADPNVAEVTVANSTANAQNMAEKFKAGG
ncbi:hypothetical protein I350_06880 [Cryptococcus amylolentus CBS 6273]|uniref:Uncharacterized protein n=1 Tax=Cryptococcus amylolentus CBS 6273 TaxID=1296118 RepID=A0A1E3JH84_9TREE|nr:hypothetical protein I350_06880 [Cryptococcus amylolentus CBS 6273]